MTLQNQPPRTTLDKRHLGIDFGNKRIGIAVSDPLNIIARPAGVIAAGPSAIVELVSFVKEYEVGTIVIGLPLTLKGSMGSKSLEVREFIERLKEVVDVPIIEWDERFTSFSAHQTNRAMGVKRKDRQSKSRIDEMAAAIILQSFLDGLKNRKTS